MFMKSCKNMEMKQTCMLIWSLVILQGIVWLPVCRAADRVIVPEGTQITLQLNKTLSTKENHEGDLFDTYVIESVYHNGQIVIPKGSTVSGSISRITRPGRFKGKAVMHLLFQSIQIPGHGEMSIHASLVRVDSDEDMDIHTESALEDKSSMQGDVGKMITPGLAGTGVGSLKENSKKAEIGGGIGLANIFWTRGKDLELYRGSTMDISLEQALKIPLTNETQTNR